MVRERSCVGSMAVSAVAAAMPGRTAGNVQMALPGMPRPLASCGRTA